MKKVRFFVEYTTTILLAVAIAALLASAGQKDYPNFHTMLDSGAAILSTLLALLLRDMGKRLSRAFPSWVSASFCVTAILEFMHVIVTAEWWPAVARVLQLQESLRPSTWSPSAYILPIGILVAIWNLLRGEHRSRLGLVMIFIVGAALVAVFQLLPNYTAPVIFGITRPFLLPVPILWLATGFCAWHWSSKERKLPSIAVMSFTIFVSSTFMLYSQAPHDMIAIVAHVGKIAGYLIFLRALMQMASSDMFDRIRAEHLLADLNRDLEKRVYDRTKELQDVNRDLKAEAGIRREAEHHAQERLERLSLFHQIARAIGERQDMERIFQVVVDSVERRLPADFCCILLQNDAATELTVCSIGGNSNAIADNMGYQKAAKVTIDGDILRCLQGEFIHLPKLSDSSFLLGEELVNEGFKSCILACLQVESSHFGILVVARRDVNAFIDLDREFLAQLGEHVGLASHQARLYEALQQAYNELRATQQTALQQERLRVLGQMASGIAHDINNALTPASLYTESLLEDETLTDRQKHVLGIIQRALDDVSQTISRTREFYRPRQYEADMAPMDVNDQIHEVLELTRSRWKDKASERGIELNIVPHLAPALPPIAGIDSEIREALVNLVLNAIDALGGGGRIDIRTSVQQNADKADVVVIEIADDGPGMSEEVLKHCCDPFFTTKGEHGTGLGLAMVSASVQRHRGEMRIDSTPGRGTTIRLIFLAIDASASPTALSTRAKKATRTLRVLVVDDDPMLLRTVRDILEADGHVVNTAIGGQAGIDAFSRQLDANNPYDLVITDLGMPNVDGRKVARSVKARQPRLPVILLTGWGHRLVAEDDIPEQVDIMLTKPPRLGELREALAKLCGDLTPSDEISS